MEWLNSHVEYWHWFVFGAILVITEVFAPGLVFLWFGLSAIVVAVLAKFLGITFTAQVFVWAALSLLSVVFLRRFMVKSEGILDDTPKTQQMFVSQVGMVTTTNAGKSEGILRFPSPISGDDQWSFSCDEALGVGEKAMVECVLNGLLIVKKYQ